MHSVARVSLLTTFLACASLACTSVSAQGTSESDVSKQTTYGAAVVVLHVKGGYEAFLPASRPYMNVSFGVNATTSRDLGDGLVVDGTLAELPTFAREHMASIGLKQGWAMDRGIEIDAATAQARLWTDSRTLYADTLAQKLATALPHHAAHTAAMITDDSGELPISFGRAESHLDRVSNVDALADEAGVDRAELVDAYHVGTSRGLGAKLAAAEVLVRTGSTFVGLTDEGSGAWVDGRTDRAGAASRHHMHEMAVPLAAFVDRMLADPLRNVTLVIVGDYFHNPVGDVVPGIVATVIGRNVKRGSLVSLQNHTFAAATPPPMYLWSYLADLARVPDAFPFADPFASLVIPAEEPAAGR